MSKVIFLLIVALILEAVGVVYLSAGLKQIGEVKTLSFREVGRVIRQGAVNGRILLGVLLETIFFGFLIVLLKRNDVSLIWPLTSLGFVLTALSARFILHEQVSPVRWVGVVLIVMGAALVSWSEKVKRPNPVRSEPATSSVQQP